MKKVLEMAKEAGYLAAYGGDPRAKVEKVPICRYEYKLDPEPLSQEENRVAKRNCESIAQQQETLLDQVLVRLTCDAAYDAPHADQGSKPSEGAPRQRPDATWAFVGLATVPLAVGGLSLLFETLFPRDVPPVPSKWVDDGEIGSRPDVLDQATQALFGSVSSPQPVPTLASNDPLGFVTALCNLPGGFHNDLSSTAATSNSSGTP